MRCSIRTFSEFAAFYTHVEQLLDDAVAEFVVQRL
jgi:hypothetical protein